jgi:hypothetical protein
LVVASCGSSGEPENEGGATASGGVSTGGESTSGASNGGASAGGTSNGGSESGGKANGGAATSGGKANGGAPASGGKSNGGGGSASCDSPADCRLFDDYCDGCTCRALATGQPDPKCSGTIVNCIIAPCDSKVADCVDGRCVAVGPR